MKLSVLTLFLFFGSSLFLGAQGTPQNQPPGDAQSAAAAPAAAQSNVASTLQVYEYPKANQPPDKQANDETECFQSAQSVNQSAPTQGEQGQPSGQSSKAGTGETVKGSAGGAATGAAIGAVAGDAGQGAAIGAAGGAAVGHRRKKKKKEAAQKEQEQQQQQQQAQATDNVKRAYTACMEARNYVVK